MEGKKYRHADSAAKSASVGDDQRRRAACYWEPHSWLIGFQIGSLIFDTVHKQLLQLAIPSCIFWRKRAPPPTNVLIKINHEIA